MFKFSKNNDVEYFVSDIFPPNVIHAFTTRKGGYAPPPLNNFSMGTAQYYDFRDFIINNRKLICSILKMNYERLVMTDQHHTDNVFLLESEDQTDPNGYLTNTDAVITKTKGLPVMLFFADCTPIMLYDINKEILALIHAGWKGTAKNLCFKTLQLMISLFNSKPDDIIAAIGPNIGKCCFEVSTDVGAQLIQTIPENCVSDKIISYKDNKAYVDLKQINALHLKASGITTIDISPECTMCKQNLFFSHRLTGGKTGRQVLIAQLD